MSGDVAERVLAELLEVKAMLNPARQLRPLTAAELMERWCIPGGTDKQRLANLAARCRAWGVEPLDGTRGMEALYRLPDVVRAEESAAGVRRR